MWDDLQALKARFMQTGKIDAMLKAWSQGSVGEKSFQRILEEFSELIIPKIWEREGSKNLSRGRPSVDLSEEGAPHSESGRRQE